MDMAAKIHNLGASTLLASYLGGRISVVAATTHYLDRIAQHSAALPAFASVRREEALAEAGESAKRFDSKSARPLEGLPIALGERAQSLAPALREAGAILIGTTASSAITNPYQPAAKGGDVAAAAAVAAGLCAAAIDQAPLGVGLQAAALCGAVGVRAGSGVLGSDGLVIYSRQLLDAEKILFALAPAAETTPIKDIGLISLGQHVVPDSSIASALRLSASLLQGLGQDIRDHGVGLVASAPAELATAANANELEAVLLMADALLLPATLEPAGEEAEVPYLLQLPEMAGLPAVVLTAGWSSKGVPVAVQLVGRRGQERALLQLGEQLETALKAWQPPLAFA